jgi:hypothetical protein
MRICHMRIFFLLLFKSLQVYKHVNFYFPGKIKLGEGEMGGGSLLCHQV